MPKFEEGNCFPYVTQLIFQLLIKCSPCVFPVLSLKGILPEIFVFGIG